MAKKNEIISIEQGEELVLSGCGVGDFPSLGPRVSIPQQAEQEQNSWRITLIVRETGLKTERTRIQTAREGKSSVLHFSLLDKIELTKSFGYCAVLVLDTKSLVLF